MINYDNLNVDINPDYTMLKKRDNGLYLSNEEIEILEENNINYQQFKSLTELINYVSINAEDSDEIDNLLMKLQERNYYENYNK